MHSVQAWAAGGRRRIAVTGGFQGCCCPVVILGARGWEGLTRAHVLSRREEGRTLVTPLRNTHKPHRA